MKKMVVVAVLALGLVLMGIPAVFALELGTNITIYDGSMDSGSTNSWYNSHIEDQEVEPGCIATQNWDLEGFFLNGDILTMVGGYDFENGRSGTTSGDIFFDIDGNYRAGDAPTSSNGVVEVSNTYGYDYALDLDFTNSQYTVYSLNSDSILHSVYYIQNQASTPWEYVSGGTQQGVHSLTYTAGLADADVAGLEGDSHNAVAIDLSDFLDPGTDFTAHFTMTCGNDNLMGQGTAPVPEPQTLLLMGIGLLGLAFVGRKKLGDRA
jgi:hypothetical protein